MQPLTTAPGQTVGPFFHYALPYDRAATSWCRPATPGDPAARHGPRRRRRPGAGRAARDLAGRTRTAASCAAPARCAGTAGPSPAGAGPPPTAPGHYSFTTLQPGCHRAGPAPFFAVTVFARGLLDRLFTRAYLPGAGLLAADPLLAGLPPDRRATLVATARRPGPACSTSACRASGRRCSCAIPRASPMSDLLWPGDERAGELCTRRRRAGRDGAGRGAWLRALVRDGSPAAAPARRPGQAGRGRPTCRADRRAAEAGGNPVIPLLALLRERSRPASRPPRWLHTGLTSQDVLDTALVLCLRDAVARLRADLAAQVRRAGPRSPTGTAPPRWPAARSPSTPCRSPSALKAAGWLRGVLDARDGSTAAALPRAVRRRGRHLAAPGRPGRLAAPAARAWSAPRRPRWACRPRALAHRPAGRSPASATRWWPAPTPGDRSPPTCCVGSRPEIGELGRRRRGGRLVGDAAEAEPGAVRAGPPRRAGRRRCSPRRCTPPRPPAVDERPDGAWHAEWATLRTLARRTVTAGAQTAELLDRPAGRTRTGWPPPWPRPVPASTPSSSASPAAPDGPLSRRHRRDHRRRDRPCAARRTRS